MKPKKAAKSYFHKMYIEVDLRLKVWSYLFILCSHFIFDENMWVDRFPLSVPAIFVFKENQNGNNDKKKIRTDRNNLTFRLRHRFDTGIEYLIPKRKLRVYLSIFLFTKYLCTYVSVRLRTTSTYKCIVWNQMFVKLFM